MISTFDHHLQNNHNNEEKRQNENAKDLIPGFVGLNLNQNSLKPINNGGKMSKGNSRTTVFTLSLVYQVMTSISF